METNGFPGSTKTSPNPNILDILLPVVKSSRISTPVVVNVNKEASLLNSTVNVSADPDAFIAVCIADASVLPL